MLPHGNVLAVGVTPTTPLFAVNLAPATVAASVEPIWPVSRTLLGGAWVIVTCTLIQGAHLFFVVDHGCVTMTRTPGWLMVIAFAVPVCSREAGREGERGDARWRGSLRMLLTPEQTTSTQPVQGIVSTLQPALGSCVTSAP